MAINNPALADFQGVNSKSYKLRATAKMNWPSSQEAKKYHHLTQISLSNCVKMPFLFWLAKAMQHLSTKYPLLR